MFNNKPIDPEIIAWQESWCDDPCDDVTHWIGLI